MCGIAGAVGPEKDQIVERMTAALVHSGPDGQGFHHDPSISLGHSRLSIIDLEGGAQPMANTPALFARVNHTVSSQGKNKRVILRKKPYQACLLRVLRTRAGTPAAMP